MANVTITKEDIALIDKNEGGYFEKSRAFLEDYKQRKNNKSLISFVKTFAAEKTLYILATNEETKPIVEKLGGIGNIKNLNDFVTKARENEETEKMLSAIVDTGEGQEVSTDKPTTVGEEGTSDVEEGEEDPWVKDCISRFKEKNLF